MKSLEANFVSDPLRLADAAVDNLDCDGDILGGVSKDGQIGWLARGAALEVFTPSSGARLAAWRFGAVVKDPSTVVTAVAEYSYEGSPRLLVATTSSSTRTGLLCLLDVRTSKVFKAVELPHTITALEPVTSVGPERTEGQALSAHLQCFCGVVAVGTHGAHTYLLDLNLDDDGDGSDELRPNSVLFLNPRIRDVASCRFSAMSKRTHLCLELGEESHQRGVFSLCSPDAAVMMQVASEDVCISSLLYLRQTCSLVVAFSLGSFQLWGLYTPVLEHTSRPSPTGAAITHMAYQEPENDPRNFVYLWVARGPLPTETIDGKNATISLYQLGYNKKAWHDGLGFLYKDLLRVGLRFEHALTSTPAGVPEVESGGSRVLACYTIHDPYYTVPEHTENEDSFGEASLGPDLSLCAFVWSSSSDLVEPSAVASTSSQHHHLAVFDMNRYYHAQMPHVLRCTGAQHDMCPFLAFYSLDRLDEQCSPDTLVTLHVNARSVARYQPPTEPMDDHHLFPSSLAFEATGVSGGSLVLARFLGRQRQALSNLVSGGPAVLVHPTDAYNLLLCAGLLPRAAVATSRTASMSEKRAAILDVLLDHNQLGLLATCVHTWATGENASAGCSLRTLLDWAWSRLGALKDSLDHLCVPLYDWSGHRLDAAGRALLHKHRVVLERLCVVFAELLSVSAATTEQGRADLEMRLMVARLIKEHVSVLVWCHSEGFLPEVDAANTGLDGDGRYAFPYAALRDYFKRRRHEIQHLNRELQGTELLMVDGLVSNADSSLQERWEQEGGSSLYPPPSLHAILNMYLLENMPLATKHAIFFYLLCDLMYLNPEETTEKFEQKMHHFAEAFSLPFSTIRLVQGFWHLDRKEFEEAMLLLLDPIIRVDLPTWQHTRIVQALLYQGRPQMALKYIRVKQPPPASAEEVKLRLTVLLANGLTAEAFEYQRSCRDQMNTEDLLSHLFLGCQQMRTMDQLLQLPLTPQEEHHLVGYMQTTTEPGSSELLILHHLQRARFTEALHLNTKLKHHTVGGASLIGRERSRAQQAIIDCYQRILPRAQRKLALSLDQASKRATGSRREVTRPVPLSITVNQSKQTEAVTQATVIRTVLSKVSEITSSCRQEDLPDTMEDEDEAGSPTSFTPAPFTGTPVTPRSRACHVGQLSYPSILVQQTSPAEEELPGSANVNHLSLLSSRTSATSARRSRRIQCAAALSLLQTPPVHRKSTPLSVGYSASQLSAPNSAATPHSILKVRHVAMTGTHSPLARTALCRSGSSNPAELSTFQRQLDMDAPAETAPNLSTSSKTPVSLSTATSNTPKQLRFSVPASPESDDRSTTPSPQPSPPDYQGEDAATAALSGRGHDRSPTPDRSSSDRSPEKVDRTLREVFTREEEGRTSQQGDTEDLMEEDASGEEMDVTPAQLKVPTRTVHQYYEEQLEEDVATETLEDSPTLHRYYEEMAPVPESQDSIKGSVSGEQAEETEGEQKGDSEHVIHRFYGEQDSDEERTDASNKVAEDQPMEVEQAGVDHQTVTNHQELVESTSIVRSQEKVDLDSESGDYEPLSLQLEMDTEETRIPESGETEEAAVAPSTVTDGGDSSSVTTLTRPETLKLTETDAEFKTPSRPARPASMPPTPPESGHGTPPQQVSPSKSESTLASVNSHERCVTHTDIVQKSRDQELHPAVSEECGESSQSKAASEQEDTSSKSTVTEETSMTTLRRSQRAVIPPRTGRSTRARARGDSESSMQLEAQEQDTTSSKTAATEETSMTTLRRSQRAVTPPRTGRSTRARARGDSESSMQQDIEEQQETSIKSTVKEETSITTLRRSQRAVTPPRTGRSTRTRARGDSESSMQQEAEEQERDQQVTTPTRRTRASVRQQEQTEELPEAVPGLPGPPTPSRVLQLRTRADSESQSVDDLESVSGGESVTGDVEETSPSTPNRTRSRTTRARTPTRKAAPQPAAGSTTPLRLTRSQAKKHPETNDKPEVDGQDMELGRPPTPTRLTRARARADSLSLSESRSATPVTDDVSVLPSSRSSSPSASIASEAGSMTPPRTEHPAPGRVTRSGGRTKAATPTRRSARRQQQQQQRGATPDRTSESTADGGEPPREEDGLLSAQSHMMALRRRRSGSRDSAVDAAQRMETASDVSSIVTEDDLAEGPNFTFSNPLPVNMGKDAYDELPGPTVQPFVFSPPITRPRLRSSKLRANTDLKEKVKLRGILPDAPLITKVAKSKTSKVKKMKNSTTTTTTTDDAVLVLSPIHFDSPDGTSEEVAPAGRQRALPRKAMTLRPTRGGSSRKKRADLW